VTHKDTLTRTLFPKYVGHLQMDSGTKSSLLHLLHWNSRVVLTCNCHVIERRMYASGQRWCIPSSRLRHSWHRCHPGLPHPIVGTALVDYTLRNDPPISYCELRQRKVVVVIQAERRRPTHRRAKSHGCSLQVNVSYQHEVCTCPVSTRMHNQDDTFSKSHAYMHVSVL
jgi:hypothetical protein